jgi:hypothetical protein
LQVYSSDIVRCSNGGDTKHIHSSPTTSCQPSLFATNHSSCTPKHSATYSCASYYSHNSIDTSNNTSFFSSWSRSNSCKRHPSNLLRGKQWWIHRSNHSIINRSVLPHNLCPFLLRLQSPRGLSQQAPNLQRSNRC